MYPCFNCRLQIPVHTVPPHLTSRKSSSSTFLRMRHSAVEPTSPGLCRSTIMSAPQAVARLCTVASEADRSSGDRPLEEHPPGGEREGEGIL